MNKVLAAGLAAAALLGGLAVAAQANAAAPARQCFYSRDITNWRAVGDKQVNLEIRSRDIYRLDLSDSCPQLRFAGPVLALEQSGGGGPICSGIQADIIVPGQGGFRCSVQTISRYSPEAAKALPKKERP